MPQANPTSIKIYAYISAAWVQLNDRGGADGANGGWGMSDNSPTTRIAQPGELSFTLDNSGGLYSPDGASSLAGWKKGLPLKMVITYAGVEENFYYRITDIKLNPSPSQQSVFVTAKDWLEDAINFPVENPTLLEDVTADSAITTLLATMPIQPQSTDLDTGIYQFPTVFDTVRGGTKAYSELAKFAFSETGYIYTKRDGELCFESADHRNGLDSLAAIPLGDDSSGELLLEDGTNLLYEDNTEIILNEATTITIDNNMIDIDATYGENIVNRWTTSTFPKRVDTDPIVLYSLEKPIPIASGETKSFRVYFTNPVGGNSINALEPEADNYTKLLVHFDEEDGTASKIDETGKTLTVVDVPTISSPVKVGAGSGYFDGTNCYITAPDSSDWDFGTGDFTIEWWEYRFNATASRGVLSRDSSASFPAFLLGYSDGTNSKVYLSSAGASYDIANGKTFGAITANTWVHYAIVRSGTTFYLFKNGTQTDTWTSSAALNTSSAVLSIGRHSTNYITACIDELRISKGVARYTADFTPSTSKFQLTGTFISAWTTATAGTGTDISDGLTKTVTYGTEGASFQVFNGSSSSGWITSIYIRGYGIYSDSSLDDIQTSTASIEEYGYSNATIKQQYQQEQYSAILEGRKQVEYNKEPRTQLNSISLCANSSDANMLAFLKLDIGDLIRVKNDDLGIDGWFYIQGVEFEIKGLIIMYKWILKQAFTLTLGLSLMACEFGGTGTEDGISFGYLPLAQSDSVTNRVFSAWVYLDSIDATYDRCIISDFMGADIASADGFALYVDNDATDRYISFFQGFTGNGKWRAPANAISLSTWTHILVSYDKSSLSNDPVIYINGVSQTVTETNAPTGTIRSEVGGNLVIGNYAVFNTATWDGKLKDVRIYNGDNLTSTVADLAAGLYAEGAGGTGYTDGMVFQALAVRTSELAGYTDLTLTADTKVLDTYLGYVGTPNGSPITRTI